MGYLQQNGENMDLNPSEPTEYQPIQSHKNQILDLYFNYQREGARVLISNICSLGLKSRHKIKKNSKNFFDRLIAIFG